MTGAGRSEAAGAPALGDESRELAERSFGGELLRLVRPAQWTKNFLVFAALLFSRSLFEFDPLLRSAALFVAFCAIASAVYIFNDWIDAPRDRENPAKAGRPLAAGTVAPAPALSVAGGLVVAGLGSVFYLDLTTGVLCSAYVLINVLYTLRLKREPILDVGCIASGFVIRAFTGATVIGVPISNWLILCSIFLALFLGFAKRRQELVDLSKDASDHRRVLEEYSLPFLDHMNAVIAAATLVCYTLYTVDDATVERFGTDGLIFTVPIVAYGIFRYLYLLHEDDKGSDPTEALLSDVPMLVTVAAWVMACGVIIYV